MLLGGFDSIRDVIAFPKSGGGYDPLTDAPAPITAAQRKEAGVDVTPEVKAAPRQESMSLPRRPDADPAALLAGLDRSLAGLGLTEVGEGFDNIAYAVRSPSGARLLLRVSKVADPVERARVLTKDVALLEFANRHSSLTTNEVIAADAHAGALLLTEVTGRTLTRSGPPTGSPSPRRWRPFSPACTLHRLSRRPRH